MHPQLATPKALQEWSLTPSRIVLAVVLAVTFVVLIQIPLTVTFVRALWVLFRHLRQRGRIVTGADMLWILSMFRLPQPFCRSHHWFVPVYYGSFVAWLVP